MNNNKSKVNIKGITLISLVVTIIVLLILAAISLTMLTGDNSILKRAVDAKEQTERAEIVENAKLDVLSVITENNGNDISSNQLKNILKTYFKTDSIPNDFPDDLSTVKLTTINERFTVLLSEIYDGNILEIPLTIGDVMEVGDWVEYIADVSEYTTTENEVGVVQTLSTDTTTKWRVWKIEDNKVIIIPSNPLNSLELYKEEGYLNGAETINNVCKQLYKNNLLAITENDIRSINLSDVEYATGIKREDTKYTINYRGNNYTYKYNDVLEFTTGNLYTYEENGKTVTTNTPKIASSENPINVKTNYVYSKNVQWNSIENKKIGTLTFGEILGKSYSWTSDKVVFFTNPKLVLYGIGEVSSSSLCRSRFKIFFWY